MACHHRHSNCATTCGCNHDCCNQSHRPPLPPPQQPPIDPLLQALAPLLLQQQQQQQQQPYYSHINHQEPSFKPENPHFRRYDHNPQTYSLLSSLLQRITNLESLLRHFSAATSSSSYSSLRDAAARVIQTHFRAFLVRRSRTLRQLKDLAFIKSSFNSLKSSVSKKTHFDSRLVSCKVTDLLLKLNSIQSGDPMISDGKRSIGREMVRFLESIDGFVVQKKVILSKTAKNNSAQFVMSGNKSRNLRSKDGDIKEIVEKLRERVDKIEGFSRACESDEEDVEVEGFHQFVDRDNDEDGDDNSNGGNKRVLANAEHDVIRIPNGVYVGGHDVVKPKVKKTVSFNDNGNVYTIYGETDESVSNEDGSLIDEIDSNDDRDQDVEEFLLESEGRKRNSKADEEAKLDNNGLMLRSYGERNPRRSLRSDDNPENKGYCWDQDGNLVFSAPMPVKMESRTDLTKKKKAVQIAT